MRLLLTRPRIDAESAARQLRLQGVDVVIDPLMAIEKLSPAPIPFESYQALIFTSPNALRSFDYPDTAKSILTFVVGKKTERVAQSIGFKHIVSANGDVNKLSETIKSMIYPKNGPLLYLSGVDVAGSLADDLKDVFFNVDVREIYKATAAENIHSDTLSLLQKGKIDYIPFYSPRSAHIFRELIKKAHAEETLANVTALCLSPAVKKVIAGIEWADIKVAKNPNQIDLYKMIDIELEGMSE